MDEQYWYYELCACLLLYLLIAFEEGNEIIYIYIYIYLCVFLHIYDIYPY